MSRSPHRALLTAPLLLGALLLSSCGGDDETPVATSPPAATTAPAGAVATSPTSPEATSPTSPETTTPAKDKKDDKPAAAGGAADPGAASGAGAGAPSGDTSTKKDAQAKPPTQAPTKSADDTQNKVLQVVAAVETCWASSQSYEKCDGPDSLDMFGVKVVNSNRPGKKEIAVTNSSRDTFKIIGTDADGVRWIITKSGSGDVKRKCKLASGQACNPATW